MEILFILHSEKDKKDRQTSALCNDFMMSGAAELQWGKFARYWWIDEDDDDNDDEDANYTMT